MVPPRVFGCACAALRGYRVSHALRTAWFVHLRSKMTVRLESRTVCADGLQNVRGGAQFAALLGRIPSRAQCKVHNNGVKQNKPRHHRPQQTLRFARLKTFVHFQYHCAEKVLRQPKPATFEHCDFSRLNQHCQFLFIPDDTMARAAIGKGGATTAASLYRNRDKRFGLGFAMQGQIPLLHSTGL